MSVRVNVWYDCPDGYIPFSGSRPINKMKRSYVRVFQEALLVAAKDRELTAETYRVFLGLLAALEYENRFEMSKTDLGKRLGLLQPAVSRAMKVLEEKGYIQQVEQKGNIKVYLLNPFVGYMSRNSKYTKISKEWDRANQEEAS